MIILALTFSHLTDDGAVFADYSPDNPYVDGFELRMPMREFRALDQPMRVEFVVSTEHLSVGRDNDVRERVA